MSNAFELTARVLTCDHCGAPIEVPIQGGQVPCGYCRATVLVTARPVMETFAATSATSDEAARLEKLRAQNGAPMVPPRHLTKLCPGLLLPEDKLAPALTLFREAREQLSRGDSPDAERDLYLLAILLSNYHEAKGDSLRLRAFLESALEAARTPPTRQMLCAMLARTAARLGEPDAARDWLGKCDPRYEDLRADSDYRATRAFLSILQGDFADVIATLGERRGDVPISVDSTAVCSLYRAHALEMARGPDAGVAELVRSAEASRSDWFVMGRSRQNNQKSGVILCPKSFEMAREKLPWSRTNPYAVPLGCVGMLVFVLGLLALFDAGYPVLTGAALVGGFLVWKVARGWSAVASDGG